MALRKRISADIFVGGVFEPTWLNREENRISYTAKNWV